MNSRTLRACMIVCAFVCATVFGELADLDGILTRAGSVDAFLADPALVGEYYTALAKFYGGTDKFSREAYDNILNQLRTVAPKVPGLRERLWETTNLGEPYAISVKMGRDSYHRSLDVDRWQSYYERMGKRLAAEAKSILDLPAGEQEKRIREILERVKKARDAVEVEVVGQSKRRAGEIRRARMAAINVDPELRAAEAYLAHRFVTSEDAVDKNNGGNADLILYFYRDARNNPEHLYRMLPENLKGLAEATLSRARNLLPSIDEMLDPKQAIFKPQHTDLKPNQPIRYEFDPIPRRFHGIFWGARMGACVGGRSAKDVTPEFWGAIALADSRLHVVMRNGEFHGVIGMNPGKIGEQTYASVALAAPDLAKQMVRVDPVTAEERPATLLSLWLEQAAKHKPQDWKGIVIADGSAFFNWGTHDAARGLVQHILGDVIGEGGKNFKPTDPMASAIVQSHQPTGLATGYSGNMILDASVPSAGRLVMLRPDIDEQLLGDSNRVRQILLDREHPLRGRLMDYLIGNVKAADRFASVVARLTDDPDPETRRRALIIAADVHPDRRAVTEALAAYLKNPKDSDIGFHVARKRLRDLGEKGTLHAPTVERLLADESPAVRIAIATIYSEGPQPDATKLTQALATTIKAGGKERHEAERLLEKIAKKQHVDASVLETEMKTGEATARRLFAQMRGLVGQYGVPYTETMAELIEAGHGYASEMKEDAKEGRLDLPTLEKFLERATPRTVGDFVRLYLRAGGADVKYAPRVLEFVLRRWPEEDISDQAYAMAKLPPTEAMREVVLQWTDELRRTSPHYHDARRALAILAQFPPDARAREAVTMLFIGNGARPENIFVSELCYSIKLGLHEDLLYYGLDHLVKMHMESFARSLRNQVEREAIIGAYLKALESHDVTLQAVGMRGLWFLHQYFKDEMKTRGDGEVGKVFLRVAMSGKGNTSSWAASMFPEYLAPAEAKATLCDLVRGGGPARDGALQALRNMRAPFEELKPFILENLASPDKYRRQIGYAMLGEGPAVPESLRALEHGARTEDRDLHEMIGRHIIRLGGKIPVPVPKPIKRWWCFWRKV